MNHKPSLFKTFSWGVWIFPLPISPAWVPHIRMLWLTAHDPWNQRYLTSAVYPCSEQFDIWPFQTKSQTEEMKTEWENLEKKNLTTTLVLEKSQQEDLKKVEFHVSLERAKVNSHLQNRKSKVRRVQIWNQSCRGATFS